eukprot:TRINITY_DN2072_c0_g1_i1.p1 TRINITY_DN2072_c0_g1~~TRINITY_DN2072_c0_g1_i1.p1  ORF type:complete len:195 (-),score=42.09 TRINITY_DN2072_c0_g1_i1:86-670(-)
MQIAEFLSKRIDDSVKFVSQCGDKMKEQASSYRELSELFLKLGKHLNQENPENEDSDIKRASQINKNLEEEFDKFSKVVEEKFRQPLAELSKDVASFKEALIRYNEILQTLADTKTKVRELDANRTSDLQLRQKLKEKEEQLSKDAKEGFVVLEEEIQLFVGNFNTEFKKVLDEFEQQRKTFIQEVCKRNQAAL